MKKVMLFVLLVSLLSGCAMKLTTLFGPAVPNSPKVRISTLEESPSEMSAEVADQIIASKAETMTIDYECLAIKSCEEQVNRIDKALPRIVIRAYINAMEVFANERELAQRPVMQPLVAEATNKRPGYFLWNTKGQHVQWWTEYPMYMMNLSDLCPAYEGKVWSERLIDEIYDKIYLPHPGLVDGIELDNLWPYVSFVNEARSTEIDLNGDGHGEDFWTLDYHWRKGISHMIEYSRQKFPKGFVITGRGFQYNYIDEVDGLTFETLFQPNMVDAMQGGNFARVNRWVSLAKPGKYYTLNEQAGKPEDNMTYLAIAFLGDGYLALDGGPSKHGVFSMTQNVYNLGQPTGPTSYPYKEVFNSKASLLGLKGEYTKTENGWIRLDAGQSISLPVTEGIMTQFIYQIVEGQYCRSTLELSYPGQLPKTTKGGFDSHRWQDGEYFAKANGQGEIKWTYVGPGHVLLTNVIQWDTHSGQLYFSRPYEKGFAVYNPGEQDIRIPVSSGGNIELKAGQGKILYFNR